MNLKMTVVGAALSMSLVPLAARADGYGEYGQYRERAPNQAWPTYQQPQQNIAPGEPRPDGRYGRFEGRFEGRGGRYELRSTQRWVNGGYQQVWVPEQCSVRERERGWYRQASQGCIPAHYDQQWTPAHYETAQQWVWVPYGHHRF